MIRTPRKLPSEALANKTNRLDEYPEFMWYYIWHHDGRRWRMGAAMMGPDYSHWHGIVDAVMDKYGRMLAWYDTQKKIANVEKSIQMEKQSTPMKAGTGEQSKRSPGFGIFVSAAAIGAVYAIYRRRSR